MNSSTYKIPVYVKIKNDLINNLLEGTYPVGSKLPSERFLAIKYDVSRVTAKKALFELVKLGYAEIYRGKGTFVKRNSIMKDNTICTGFTAHLKEQGLENYRTKALKIGKEPSPEALALVLKIRMGDPVYIIDRVRFLNDEVIAVEYSRLPCSLFPGLLDHNLETESLYDILKNEYGVTITYSTQNISLYRCDENFAGLFDIDLGEPLFKEDNIICFSDSIPFESCTSFYRNDFTFFSSRKENVIIQD